MIVSPPPRAHSEPGTNGGAGGVASKSPGSEKRFYLEPLQQLVMPRLFFLCLAIGFAACCFAGYLTSLKNQYADHPRFGQPLSPEANFTPTFCQLRAIVQDRAKADDIVVIIGGDSVLNGVGQPESRLWSRKLQSLLGKKFVVANLAMRAGWTLEGGYLVAESLSNQYKKLIFITDAWPASCGRGGFSRYDCFYFDGLYKGLLRKNSAREQDMAVHIAAATREDKAQWEELALHKRLDSLCYFDDLWTTVGYKAFFTVWSSRTREYFTQPRRRYPDNEGALPPVFERYYHYLKTDLAIVRGFGESFFQQDPSGRWVAKEDAWQEFERQIRFVPEDMRKKTLVLLIRSCPFFLEKLSPDEQVRNAAAYRETARRWQAAGYHACVAGANFKTQEYVDRCHLTPAAGDKLAATTAEQVQSIARELGYIQ